MINADLSTVRRMSLWSSSRVSSTPPSTVRWSRQAGPLHHTTSMQLTSGDQARLCLCCSAPLLLLYCFVLQLTSFVFLVTYLLLFVWHFKLISFAFLVTHLSLFVWQCCGHVTYLGRFTYIIHAVHSLYASDVCYLAFLSLQLLQLQANFQQILVNKDVLNIPLRLCCMHEDGFDAQHNF